MSSQIFLHFDIKGRAIHGDASTIGYEGEIEVESFSFELGEESDKAKKKAKEEFQEAKAAAKKEGKPKPKPTENEKNSLTLTKFYDKASTNFARYLAAGTAFDEAIISVDHHVAAGGKKANPAMMIVLTNGRIKSVGLDLSDSDKSSKLMETIKLSYRKIEVTYFKAGKDDRSNRVFDSTFSYTLENLEA